MWSREHPGNLTEKMIALIEMASERQAQRKRQSASHQFPWAA